MEVGLRKASNRNTPFHEVTVGPLTLYFSYQTCVAFYPPAGRRVVSENVWGPTTGRHLNELDGGRKDERTPRAEFEKQLDEVLALLDPRKESKSAALIEHGEKTGVEMISVDLTSVDPEQLTGQPKPAQG